MFSEASLYTILTSRCSILVFFRRLVDFVIIEISFIYEMYLTRPELAWGVSNMIDWLIDPFNVLCKSETIVARLGF
jgi:hypothetical protein